MLNVSPYKSPMKDLGSVLLPRTWTTPHRSSTLAFTFLEEIPSCCVTNGSTLTDSHRPAVSGALTYCFIYTVQHDMVHPILSKKRGP